MHERQAMPVQPWTPDNWPMPAAYDPAPIGCTKWMLTAWLAARHSIRFDHADYTIAQMVQIIESMFQPFVVVCSRPEGGTPATWDVWNFVVKHVKRISGGQQALFGSTDES